jgi:hypothetical protein
MSTHQHDMNIANAVGPTARADINAALVALRSLNSGVDEPASTAEWMLWLDEDNMLLKLRNSSNTAWIELPISISSSNRTSGALIVAGSMTSIGDLIMGLTASGWALVSRPFPSGDYLQITQAASGTPDMTKGIQLRRTTGRVGIGVDNPAQMLSVNGKIQSLSGGLVFPDATEQNTAGSIVRLHQVQKTDTYSTSSGTWDDVTGLSLSITPASASSIFMVTLDLKASSMTTLYSPGYFRLMRDSTPISVGVAGDNRTECTGVIPCLDAGTFSDRQIYSLTAVVKDSPATASAIVYKVQVKTSGGGHIYVNRTQLNDDAAYCAVACSSIVVQEVVPGVI